MRCHKIEDMSLALLQKARRVGQSSGAASLLGRCPAGSGMMEGMPATTTLIVLLHVSLQLLLIMRVLLRPYRDPLPAWPGPWWWPPCR
jgi:hypothetical protein